MKNLKRIDEAVGSIVERRASADRLLKDVVNGNTSEVEGIKLSKEMAQGFLDWLKYSTYGKKFGALPFYKLFTASFNWGLDRFVKGANTKLKAEFKELKSRASEMRKAEKFEALKSLDEAIDLLKSSWKGTKGWNDVARIMDAGLKKAIKTGNVPISYAKDYVKSLEMLAKRNAKKFFDEYGNFTEEDFIEDVEYNMANESKDFKPHMMYDPETGEEYKAEKPEDHERMAKLGYIHEKPESVDEARFVKSYDTKVNDAETKKEVSKIYPKAKFFIGKLSHFFGELEPNLFFKAYYPKYYKQDTGKSIKGDFKITSVYSKKGSNYVELMESFESYGKFVSENYDTEQRKEMAAKGFALADGSFPIANLEDLKNAIQAYGRAKDQAKAAKFIVKRAKALGAEDLVPDTDDFQKSLDEVYTQVPAETIAVTEGKDIGSWNQGGLKGDKNVLITTFVGPKDIEDFGLGRKCMQINVGMDYISLNPADIAELKDILKSYKVK